MSWAPQEEVLAHKAVGGVLIHSQWVELEFREYLRGCAYDLLASIG